MTDRNRLDEIQSRIVPNHDGTALILSDDGDHALGDIVYLLAEVAGLRADLAARDATIAERTRERDDARSTQAQYEVELRADGKRLDALVSERDRAVASLDSLIRRPAALARRQVREAIRERDQAQSDRESFATQYAASQLDRDTWRARAEAAERDRDEWKRAAESQNRQWSAKCTELTEMRARAEAAEIALSVAQSDAVSFMHGMHAAEKCVTSDQRYEAGFDAGFSCGREGRANAITELTQRAEAADSTLTGIRVALTMAGVPEDEAYPDEDVDDHEQSLRAGGRMIDPVARIERLRERAEAAEAILPDAYHAFVRWAADEDGIHDEAWPVFERIAMALTWPTQHSRGTSPANPEVHKRLRNAELRAEAAERRVAWHPIETAPIATWVLLRHVAASGTSVDVGISHGSGHPWWDSTGEDQIRNPTHWMPLPSTDVTEPAKPEIDPTRCRICNWPLKERIEEGCTAGSCSYRPDDGSPEWYRIRERRRALDATKPEPAGGDDV